MCERWDSELHELSNLVLSQMLCMHIFYLHLSFKEAKVEFGS